MPVEYSTLELNYSYKKVEYQEYEIKYVYDLIAYQVANYDLVYNIDASAHATTGSLSGHWSDHTQIICNNLPLWHAGRYNQTSNYQQVINSFAINSESNYDFFTNIRKNSFLTTANNDDIYSGHVADYPKNIPDDSELLSNNLLYNSDFSIPARALSDMPCMWSSSKSTGASIKLNTTYSLSAGNSLEISTNSGEHATVYQSYGFTFAEGQDATLSAMVNVPNSSGDVDANASGSANLMLEVLYVDGTVDIARVDIPLSTTETGYLETNLTGSNTSVHISQWQRLTTSLNFNKPVVNTRCSINSNYKNNTSDFKFYADCLQLEVGDRASSWKKYYGDNLPWIIDSTKYLPNRYDIYSNNTSSYTSQSIILNSNTSYIEVYPKTPLYFTVDENQFFHESIPTRIVSVETSTNAGISTTRHGVATNVYDTVINSVEYLVDPLDPSKIKKQAFGLRDNYGSFSIAERDYFGNSLYDFTILKDHYSSGNISYSLSIKAITMYNSNVLAFCREELESDVYYTFKFISPERGFKKNYFECIQDYKVSDATKDIFTGVENNGVVFNFIGKIDGENNRFVVSASDDTTYEILFAYDYYINASSPGHFLTREKYDQICIT